MIFLQDVIFWFLVCLHFGCIFFSWSMAAKSCTSIGWTYISLAFSVWMAGKILHLLGAPHIIVAGAHSLINVFFFLGLYLIWRTINVRVKSINEVEATVRNTRAVLNIGDETWDGRPTKSV